MTIYGIDIASWQAGLDFRRVRAEGFEYVIAKATEGSDYRNPEYARQRDGSRENDLAFCAYHYVKASASAAAQVDNYARTEPDKAIPVMLDHEAGSGDVNVLRAVHDEFTRRGYRVILTYIPRWYWRDHIGSPSLAGLPPIMSSDYGRERAGYASAIYPGDDNVGWGSYGGIDVAVFQFSQKGAVAGKALDVNAFRGTRADLDIFFSGKAIDTEEPAMALDQAAQNTIAIGAGQLQPFAPAPDRPGLRQPINASVYNVKDAAKGGWPWLIWADLWNEIVWDGYRNPVDEADGLPAEKVRRGGLVSYILGIYRETVLNGRKLDKILEQMRRGAA